MLPKIAIGCPVRNRAWVLDDYLSALHAIDYPYKEYLFLLNNNEDASGTKLQAFMQEHKGLLYERYDEAAPGHRREEYNANGYSHLAAVRNAFVDLFLQNTTCDYLFSIDSDIIVPPDIILQLLPLTNTKTIIAAAISNIPEKALDGRTPGNFMIDIKGFIQHPLKYPISGVMGVDITGAVYLIPRGVLESGVRYAPHPQGEDILFCLSAKAKGYQLFVNLDVLCEHRMIEPKHPQ